MADIVKMYNQLTASFVNEHKSLDEFPPRPPDINTVIFKLKAVSWAKVKISFPAAD